jgi:hypothetical protein
MAALFWNSEVRTLTPGTGHIGALKIVIENVLKEKGFLDVRRNDLEVAGGKNGVWLSIAHFHIDGPRFWEVVMASGDDLDITKNIINEVVNKLRSLVFFD